MIKKKNGLEPQINPSSGRRVITDVVAGARPKREITSQLFREPPPKISRPRTKKSGKRAKKIAAAILILFLAAAIWSVFFTRMEITLSPRTASVALDKTLFLAKNPGAGALVFRTLALPETEEDNFPATQTLSESAKAQGVVVIFNKSKDAQVLIASTRLEASNGNIYRLPRTIVIPGSKAQNGSALPGSREVTVIADKAGPDYNLGLSDFTLPGLKGTPKYDLVFARSKTEMTGGAAGNQIIVGQGDYDAASKNLASRGQGEAQTLISQKIPAEEFLLKPSAEFSAAASAAAPPVGTAADNFDLKISGEARAATVNKEELEAALLNGVQDLESFGSAKIGIKNLDGLNFKLAGYKFGAESFSMEVSGQALIQTAVDEESIKNAIVSGGLSDAGAILNAFPGFARAAVGFKPFWMGLFYAHPPSDPARIDIIFEGS